MKIILVLVLSLYFISCSSISRKKPPLPVKISEKRIFILAKKFYKKSAYKKSKILLKKIIKKPSGSLVFVGAHMLLGDIERRQKDCEKASDHYLSVINGPTLNPREGEAYLKTLFCLKSLGKIDEALSLAERGVRSPHVSSKEKKKILKIKAEEHLRSGDTLQAIHSYMVLYKKSPDKISYKLTAENLTGKLSTDDLRRVADSSSFLKFLAHYKLGVHYIKEGDLTKAQEHLEIVAFNGPKTASSKKAEELIAQIRSRHQSDPKTIGVILPLSGKHAHIAEKVLRGLQLGLGIFGKNRSDFSLAIINSASSPDKAQGGVEKLVTENNVIAIVGGLLGKTAFPIAQKSQELGLPSIILSQKSGITEVGNYIFRSALTSQRQVEALVTTVMNKGVKKFAILYPKDFYGKEYAHLFWSEVIEHGGEVTAIQSYEPKTRNFSDPIKKLVGIFDISHRKNEHALLLKKGEGERRGRRRGNRESPENLLRPVFEFEALFVPDTTKAIAQIAPLLAYHDIKGPFLLGTNLWNSPSLLRRGGKYVNGSIFIDELLSVKGRLKQTEFYKNYQKVFKSQARPLAAKAYDIGLILRQVIDSGQNSRVSLRDGLAKLTNFEGSLGSISFVEREIRYPLVKLGVSRGKIKEMKGDLFQK